MSNIRRTFIRTATAITATLALVVGLGMSGEAGAQTSRPAGVPKAGESSRIDEIIKRGTLRVGVLSSYPWLFRNKRPDLYGNNEPWRGSSWVLAKEYAAALGVKLEQVDVSNETKVPLAASGGIDITVTALAPSPERAKVVDFIDYSSGSFCMIGLKNNPKLAKITAVEQLDDSNITVGSFIGTVQQTWSPKQFPKAKMRNVTGSGPGAIDEILSGRSDVSAFDNPEWPKLQHAYPGKLVSIPADCENSTLGGHPVSHAVAKNQAVFLEFLRSVQKKVAKTLQDEDHKTFAFAAEHPDQL